MRKRAVFAVVAAAALFGAFGTFGGVRAGESAAWADSTGGVSNDSANVVGAPVPDPNVEKAFRKSVRKVGAPWWSAKDESVVFLPPPKEKKPKAPSAASSAPSRGTVDFFDSLRWIVLGVGIALLVAALLWALAVAWKARRPRKEEDDERAKRARRLESLAPEARERFDDLDAATEDAIRAGDWRAATVFYFSRLIVESDKRGMIDANKGKTNRDYWFELASEPEARAIYRTTADEFERVYFGGEPATRESFERVWALRPAFDAILRRKDEEAAARALAAKAKSVGTSSVDGTKLGLLWAAAGTAALCGAASGCGGPRWNERHAEYAEPRCARSFDGVSVFADYCRSNGRRVRFENGGNGWDEETGVDGARFETVVWFFKPNPFELALTTFETKNESKSPRPEVDAALREARESAERWLREKSGRTLVVVDDGWSAAVDFWAAEEAAAPDEAGRDWAKARREAAERERAEGGTAKLERLKEAFKAFEANATNDDESEIEFDPNDDETAADDDESEIEFDPNDDETVDDGADASDGESDEQSESEEDADAAKPDWARFEFSPNPGTRSAVGGADDWTRLAPPTKECWTSRVVRPGEGSETLLSLDGEPLVVAIDVGESRVFVVSSGRFLLNYPLTTDSTSRAWAAKLAENFSPTGDVAFVCGSRLRFVDESERAEPVSPFSLSRLTPFSAFVWNAIVLALLAVACGWPILGRPKRIAPERTNDFSRHIDAVAELLRRADARNWTRERIETFRAERSPGDAFVSGEDDETEPNAESKTGAEPESAESADGASAPNDADEPK